MRRLFGFLLLIAFVSPGAFPARAQDAEPSTSPTVDVRIAAPLSTKLILTEAAHALRDKKNLDIEVSANFTSADALDALANGKVDMAFMTKPLSGEDRAMYPSLDLVVTPVGMEVAALGVSSDLWDAGLHAISQQDMRGIYEQRITNWKSVGGPDGKITLFNYEQGGGIWEIFAQWLYGDNRRAPIPKVDSVANSQDARDSLEFNSGSVAPLGVTLVDGARCHALGIKLSDRITEPTPDAVAAGIYPLARPIIAITVGRPTLSNRVVTEYLTGPDGQVLIRSTGAYGLEAVPKPPPEEAPFGG